MGTQGDYSAADLVRDKKMNVAKMLGGIGLAVIFIGCFVPVMALVTVGTALSGNGILVLLLAISMISFIISWRAWKRMVNYSFTVSGGYIYPIWLMVYSLYGWYTWAGAEDIADIVDAAFDTGVASLYVALIVVAHILIFISAIIGATIKYAYNIEAREKIRELRVGETDEGKIKERGRVCPNCGKKCEADERFCSGCGTKLEEETDDGRLSTATIEEPEEELDNSIEGLLNRARNSLKSGVFLKVEDLCTQILKEDSENAEAYLIRFMASQRIVDRGALTRSTTPLTESEDYGNALRYADAELKAELERYVSVANGRNREKSYENAVKMLELVKREKDNRAKLKLLNEIIEELKKAAGWEDSDKKLECCEEEKRAFVAEVYENAKGMITKLEEEGGSLMERISALDDVAEQFLIIEGFFDSREMYEECMREKASCEKKLRIRNICIVAGIAFVLIAACMG